jgi:hypothetical protein
MRRMSRADRARWGAARTVADLAELTAQWLTGQLGSRPGYAAGYGPDPETTEVSGDVLPALVIANHAGFLTEQSQPGYDGAGDDGARWRQLAAVAGFAEADTLARVRKVFRGTRCRVIAHPGARPWYRRGAAGVVATDRNGRAVTDFGGHLSAGDIAGMYDVCHRDAVTAVIRAWQVTVIDPVWGANDALWPALSRM